MIEFKEDPLTVLDYTAQHCGFLEVQLIPCDKAGKEGTDFAVDDPSDLVSMLIFHLRRALPFLIKHISEKTESDACLSCWSDRKLFQHVKCFVILNHQKSETL
jgi:hypothetical protein